MKNRLLIPLLMGASALIGNIVQPQTTPEQEIEILQTIGKTTHAPLSQALHELIQGISDQTFDEKFFSKIKEAEKNKLTGELVENWPDGTQKFKATFKKGKVDGHVHGWFSDGEEAFKAFFYENKKVGIHIAFNPRGEPRIGTSRIARLLSYDWDGQLHGEQIAKYYGNRLKAIIHYDHGILHGNLGKYDQELRSKSNIEVRYENGKIVSK